MDAFSSLLIVGAVVALVLGIWRILRSRVKRAHAHSEPRSAGAPTPARSAGALEAAIPETPRDAVAPPAPPAPPPGPTAALVTYRKADGSTRVRNLTLYSRNLKDGLTYSLNCRQDGERITKQFLLGGISRLELPGLVPPLVLSTPQEISSWLERHIPERSSAQPPSRKPPAVSEPLAAVTESKEVPAAPKVETLQAPPPPPPVPPQPQPPRVAPLPELLPSGARGFAVLDLETTGTGRSCRIVEVALVRLDPQGRITEEWDTLVHPGQPIPNAHIHGIDDALVAGAPRFADIAGILAAKLHDHVVVAHNLRSFDGPILEAHFAEVDGIELSLGSGLDTMPTPRVKLVELCARHGVVLEQAVAHTALGDTRALARALRSGMAHLEPATSAVTVHHNGLMEQPARTLTRAMATAPVTATAAAVRPSSGWSAVTIQLEAGQPFITTGPASTKTNTEIKRAEAYGIRLGLEYCKVNAIPKRNPPAFVLSTSLTLDTRKMTEAREQGLPVVLCSDFLQARIGSSVRAWRYAT